jgi:hypothetical protein
MTQQRTQDYHHKDELGHRHRHGHGLGHGHGDEAAPGSWWQRLRHAIRPHSHDAADSIDNAIESSAAGIRAVKVSLVALAVTAGLQLAVVVISGSVALLADTVHNFSDAFTALPLWIAFVIGRRAATRRYTYGFGRAEDLAGLFVVAMIGLSALVAGWESIRRLIAPVPVHNLAWVAAAGVIGFAGNEAVAIYRSGRCGAVASRAHRASADICGTVSVAGSGGPNRRWPESRIASAVRRSFPRMAGATPSARRPARRWGSRSRCFRRLGPPAGLGRGVPVAGDATGGRRLTGRGRRSVSGWPVC